MNGSYLVFRQLSQDVTSFWRYCDEQTRQHDGTSNAAARTRLAVKDGGTMAGRCAAREVAGEGRSGVQQRERFPVSLQKAMRTA